MKNNNNSDMTYNEKAHYHAGARIVLEQLTKFLNEKERTIEELREAIASEIKYRTACVEKNRKLEFERQKGS